MLFSPGDLRVCDDGKPWLGKAHGFGFDRGSTEEKLNSVKIVAYDLIYFEADPLSSQLSLASCVVSRSIRRPDLSYMLPSIHEPAPILVPSKSILHDLHLGSANRCCNNWSTECTA